MTIRGGSVAITAPPLPKKQAFVRLGSRGEGGGGGSFLLAVCRCAGHVAQMGLPVVGASEQGIHGGGSWKT